MSNKLAAKPVAHTNGRKADRPHFVTTAGYTIHYRYLSQETIPRLDVAARLALAGERPPIPTQRLETGPGQWSDVENPHDEKYQETLEGWEARVQEEAGRRFLTLCEQYALIYEIDQEEVDALKIAQAAVGDPLDDMTDAHVFLWWIAMPTPDDQMTLYGKLFGGLSEEAIQAQKASFLSNLQGQIAQNSPRAPAS
jgi:hypothetical protein